MKCEYNNNISDEFAMCKTINLILFDKKTLNSYFIISLIFILIALFSFGYITFFSMIIIKILLLEKMLIFLLFLRI